MNILFLAFESEATAMGSLAARFKAAGHRVFVASCDHYTVTHLRDEVPNYYRSQGLTDAEFTNLAGVFQELNAQPLDLPATAVDWDFLKRFEERYCRERTLLQLVAMDPLMLPAYHHRYFYFRPKNKNLLFKYLELQARWLERVFDRMQPDVVFTINFQYFLKATAFTMCRAMGTPFLSVATCRIRNLHLAYDNFMLGTPTAVRDEMARLERENAPCADAAAYIDELTQTGEATYANVEIGWADAYVSRRAKLGTRVKEILRHVVQPHLWYRLLRNPSHQRLVREHYRGVFKEDYFLPSYRSILKTLVIAATRSIGYFRRPELTRTDIPTEPFVYFPLHMIPESTVLTLSETFDEMECLFQLSKALPIGWKIVVKPNPGMVLEVDTHPNSYYEAMNALPNVQFANPLMRSSVLLEKCSAVACLAGTALLEGAMHGKPGIRWGRTDYEAVDLIAKFDSAQVPVHLARRGSRNIKYYVQACMNVGIPLRMSLVNGQSLTSMSPDDRQQYEEQIGRLEQAIYRYTGARQAGTLPPERVALATGAA